jgi:transcriptional regulator EpsA
MDDLTSVSPKELGHLWRAMESALGVGNRGQFFLWTQGLMQAAVPHQVLVAISHDREGRAVHIDCMQGVPLEAGQVERLTHLQDGLIARLANHCRQAQAQLVLWNGEDCDPAHPLHAFVPELRSLTLHHVLAHDTGLTPHGGGFYALFSLDQRISEKQVLLLKVLMPHLHLAFLRSQQPIQEEPATPDDSDGSLTERQIEILHWVKLGKTNFEIAQILDISALTVKNHMQKLFKKLNVHNRAQAVAKTMAMNFPTRN